MLICCTKYILIYLFFFKLSNMYEDYLEEFVYNTAALFGKRLFRKKQPEEECNVDVCAETIEENTISEISNADEEKLNLLGNENLETFDEVVNKQIKNDEDSLSKIDEKINNIADDFEMLVDNQKKSNENNENNVVAETLTEGKLSIHFLNYILLSDVLLFTS